MQPKPVRKADRPAYLTRSELLDAPGLLEKRQPRAWRARSGLAGAVAALLAVHLAGCGGGPAPQDRDPFSEDAPDPIVAEASDWVRSIFDDGSSRGMLGCVAITAPVYLPEDEAIQVFNELHPQDAK